jgi:hypothetical protein
LLAGNQPGAWLLEAVAGDAQPTRKTRTMIQVQRHAASTAASHHDYLGGWRFQRQLAGRH